MATSYSDSSPTGAMEALDLDSSASAAGSGIFSGDMKKHDDLKTMLDSSKESHKLEAMKRIIGMIARGRDCSDLFPAVVKNVVSKNIEIKKLVYVYLTRYAEEQQDLALLSISTFQRALKDPNQLIRASALRVLSSIRVTVIVPIVMLAIRDSAVDMSPFVRKTAAHAIPKLHSIDPDQKEELIGLIEKLLADRTTLVVGSAVMAFEEVCPERIELIHKQFRKLCNLIADIDEWGQVVIVNMLLRYARTQFVDPNKNGDNWEKEVKDFYDSENEESDDDEDQNDQKSSTSSKKAKSTSLPMDPDHRLLLKSAKPLLQSRNAAVVMATAQLFYHCAPKPEVQAVAKAMIRLLRSHTEVQCLVLNCIASMTSEHSNKTRNNSMFEPHLRNFFIRSGSDPTHLKILKLEILTNLATPGNIGIILREFQSYITGQDKVCVAATIQSIGRCAATIEEVTDTCLNGLVHLLSNRDEAVVAESVVVIKRLLQTQAGDHIEIIEHMAKLVDTITEPAAKSAILWVLGEYNERVPKIAPDVLRKMAKTFPNEDPQVKLQILNLAVKLCLNNPKQTKLLTQYVFNLAKYDVNYDIRDRARFMRAFLFPPAGQENNKLIKHGKKIFLASKPAPASESKFMNRQSYQLGSMSHYLNSSVSGYHDLPDFPEVAPDPEVRNVEPPRAPNPWEKTVEANKAKKKAASKAQTKNKNKTKGFYSEESEDESSNEDSNSGSGSSSSSSSGSGTESDEEDSANKVVKKDSNTLLLVSGIEESQVNAPHDKENIDHVSEDSESDSSSDSSDSSVSDESSEEEEVEVVKAKKKSTKSQKVSNNNTPKTNLDLLLSLDEDISGAPVMNASAGGKGNNQMLLTPSSGSVLLPSTSGSGDTATGSIEDASAMFVSLKETELLSKMTTGGLQVQYRYTRKPHLFSASMTSIQLTLNNLDSNEDLTDIKIGSKTLASGMSMHDFPGISKLTPNESRTVNIGINFNDSTQAAKFDIVSSGRVFPITIQAPVGELVKAVAMSEIVFNQKKAKLRGMNEMEVDFELPSQFSDDEGIKRKIYESVNVLQVPMVETGSGGLKFAGKTVGQECLCLITFQRIGSGKARLIINCEKIVIGNMLAKEVKNAFEKC